MPRHNPYSDIASGRTSTQIEQAKREQRGRFGGVVPTKRKKCKRGKSCGASCISGSLVCMVDIPMDPAALTKVATEIQTRGKAPETRETTRGTQAEQKANKPLMEFAKELRSLYREIKSIKESGLPSGEQEWRISEIRGKIDELRSNKGTPLMIDPDDRKSSRDTSAMVRLEDKLKLGSLSKRELIEEAGSKVVQFVYHHLNPTEALPVGKSIEELRNDAIRYVRAMPEGDVKAWQQKQLDLALGREKSLKVGSLDQTLAAGKEIMDKYRSQLDSSMSIMRRSEKLVQVLEDRISGTRSPDRRSEFPDSAFERSRLRTKLRSVMFRISGRQTRAERRAWEAMVKIREEMLRTNLTAGEINKILGGIKFSESGIRVNGPEHKAVKEQIKEFARMFNGKGLLSVEGPFSYATGLSKVELSPERAHALLSTIRVGSRGAQKDTLFHEIGHLVENHRPWLQSHMVEWRDKRAATASQIRRAPKEDELKQQLINPSGRVTASSGTRQVEGEPNKEVPLYRLNALPAGRRSAYTDDEVVVLDRFLNPYMGKVYSSNHTEVFTMAIQQFSHEMYMVNLYRKHPDLFELVVGMSQT